MDWVRAAFRKTALEEDFDRPIVINAFGSINSSLDPDSANREQWAELGDLDLLVHVAMSLPLGVGWLNHRVKKALVEIALTFGVEAKMENDLVYMRESFAGRSRWLEVNLDLVEMETLATGSALRGAFDPSATYLAEAAAIPEMLVPLEAVRRSVAESGRSPTLEYQFDSLLSDALSHGGVNLDKTLKRLASLKALSQKAGVTFGGLFDLHKPDFRKRLHAGFASLMLRDVETIRRKASGTLPRRVNDLRPVARNRAFRKSA